MKNVRDEAIYLNLVGFIRKELLCNFEHGIYNMNLVHRRGAKKTDRFVVYDSGLNHKS